MNDQKDIHKIDSPKEVAYYSALVHAWINTRLDQDKSIIVLSSAGIGLIVTLLTAIGPQDYYEIILYIISMACFSIAIISAVVVLGKNSNHIEKVIKGDKSRDPYLRYWDGSTIAGFIIGIVFLIIIGVISGLHQLKKKGGTEMETTIKISQKVISASENAVGTTSDNIKSLNGIGKIAPSDTHSDPSSSSDNSTNESSSNHDQTSEK